MTHKRSIFHCCWTNITANLEKPNPLPGGEKKQVDDSGNNTNYSSENGLLRHESRFNLKTPGKRSLLHDDTVFVGINRKNEHENKIERLMELLEKASKKKAERGRVKRE